MSFLVAKRLRYYTMVAAYNSEGLLLRNRSNKIKIAAKMKYLVLARLGVRPETKGWMLYYDFFQRLLCLDTSCQIAFNDNVLALWSIKSYPFNSQYHWLYNLQI